MVLERVREVAGVVPASPRRIPGWVAAAAVPVVVAVVLAGVWLTGALLTEDAAVAMVLTGAWFAVAGGLAVVAGLRWRRLAVPVVGAWLVTSVAVGGYLLVASTVDRVADEEVLVAPRAGSAAGGSGDSDTSGGPATSDLLVLIAQGGFRDAAHSTAGQARLIERPDGSRVLTLTRFETDPGPDLRVYLVPGDGSSVRDAVDLGGLKGNRGDQQYVVPDGAPEGAVVIWCRAFSVAFGAAALRS